MKGWGVNPSDLHPVNFDRFVEHQNIMVMMHEMTGYRRIRCIDQAGFGIEAFRMVIPDDWTCYGGITWVNDMHMPVYINFAVASPDGLIAFEGFPILKFTWSSNPMAVMNQQLWQSQSTKVAAPMQPDEVLLKYIIAPFRQKMQPYRIVLRGPVHPDDPMVADAFTPRIEANVRFGKVRIAYEIAENPIEEEFYAGVLYEQVPVIGGNFILWQMQTGSIRAPEGHLEENLPLFRTMKASLRPNEIWVRQLTDLMIGSYQQQIANIQQIGVFSRKYSHMQDRLREQRIRSWEESNRQFEADRAVNNTQIDRESPSERFSREAILGLERRWDPYEEKEIDVEGGHVDVWINALGDRILSDSYNYNPDEHLMGNWKRMETL